MLATREKTTAPWAVRPKGPSGKKRRRRDQAPAENFATGWFGRYLFYIPTQNTLIVRRAGAPLAQAQIDVFQQQDGTIPDYPKFTGTTDDAGRFVLPSQTTLEYAQAFSLSAPLRVANPFSTVYSDTPHVVGINGVLLFRISDRDGNRAYRFTDLLQFGLEYARGHVDNATYVVDLP